MAEIPLIVYPSVKWIWTASYIISFYSLLSIFCLTAPPFIDTELAYKISDLVNFSGWVYYISLYIDYVQIPVLAALLIYKKEERTLFHLLYTVLAIPCLYLLKCAMFIIVFISA